MSLLCCLLTHFHQLRNAKWQHMVKDNNSFSWLPSAILLSDFSPTSMKNRLHIRRFFHLKICLMCLLQNALETLSLMLDACETSATPRYISSLQQAQNFLLFKQTVDDLYLPRHSIDCCCRLYSATCLDWCRLIRVADVETRKRNPMLTFARWHHSVS